MRKIKLIVAALVVAIGLSFAFAAPAAASSFGAVEAAQGAITFDISWLLVVSAVSAVIMPIATGLLTNSNWSSRAKAILHLALSGIGGILAELADWLTVGGDYNIGVALLSALVTFGIGVGVYLGLMKAPDENGNSFAKALAVRGIRAK